jgi:adenosylcobinamide-phosphate synthase
MRIQSLTAAYILDWLLGDPEFLPHPVRLVGAAADSGERLIRPLGPGPAWELASGTALTVCITAGSGFAAWGILRSARRLSPLFAASIEVLLGASCLATRNLLDEAQSVLAALEADDLPRARVRLSRIVGRDTAMLDEPEVARALIETLAESLCDGIIAPLFYLAIGGVPAAMAYKAVNTLDSMIGHRDLKYFWFGKTAARLDDVANYLPARLTALLICASAGALQQGNAANAFRTWRRDGRKHLSPNAGQPESAMAGALQVQLGGLNTYRGEQVQAPVLGEGFPRPSRSSARQALTITAVASLMGFAVAFVFLAGRQRA